MGHHRFRGGKSPGGHPVAKAGRTNPFEKFQDGLDFETRLTSMLADGIDKLPKPKGADDQQPRLVAERRTKIFDAFRSFLEAGGEFFDAIKQSDSSTLSNMSDLGPKEDEIRTLAENLKTKIKSDEVLSPVSKSLEVLVDELSKEVFALKVSWVEFGSSSRSSEPTATGGSYRKPKNH